MIFLALYDARGQCQRVATASNQNTANLFLDMGFIEVDQDEYNRCAALVPESDGSDLNAIRQARAVLAQPSRQRALRVSLNLDALERLQSRQVAIYRQVTQSYIDADISLDQWEQRMVDNVKSGLLAASTLGVGGRPNLSQDDYRDIRQDNKTQIGYLKRFRRDIETLSPAQTLNRASLYAGATRARYWTAYTRALGLPSLPAMPGVRTSCGSNCKCNWNIIELPGVGNWDCQWRISAVESCPECLMRQRTFNPLEIRNFVVQPFNTGGLYV